MTNAFESGQEFNLGHSPIFFSGRESPAVIGHDALAPIIIMLSQNATNAKRASTVGLHKEWLVLAWRHQYRLGGDGVLEGSNGLLAFFRLGFRRHVAILPREPSERSGKDGKATNEVAVVRAKTEKGADLRNRVDF
jgi:hypothetical protein